MAQAASKAASATLTPKRRFARTKPRGLIWVEFLKACRTDVDEVRELLDAGAAVFQANTHGFTGLHVAAANLQMDTVQVMEANGLTPLDYCVDAGFAAVETDGSSLVPVETKGTEQ
ncbi:hypothetical protein AK812_SmicGene42104 [Symbiodinium microadriaticum]|uniref:Uncharacterized protein n=1 Tax=Symbiodinium microadriaticum TaxID=2951 RepID=A0A1Q9C4F7_SYMMI|nr:hypothetical protein AK812_SmicGene42104 [Symbiodinium microadriaticum]